MSEKESKPLVATDIRTGDLSKHKSLQERISNARQRAEEYYNMADCYDDTEGEWFVWNELAQEQEFEADFLQKQLRLNHEQNKQKTR